VARARSAAAARCSVAPDVSPAPRPSRAAVRSSLRRRFLAEAKARHRTPRLWLLCPSLSYLCPLSLLVTHTRTHSLSLSSLFALSHAHALSISPLFIYRQSFQVLFARVPTRRLAGPSSKVRKRPCGGHGSGGGSSGGDGGEHSLDDAQRFSTNQPISGRRGG
jgi:uncharacterized membrane protein YgcG